MSEFISSWSQIVDVPEPRREEVELKELKKRNGEGSKHFQYELTTAEHDEFELSDKVLNEVGDIIRIKRSPSRAIRFLAYTTRDDSGNRLFTTIEAADKALSRLGKSITNKMLTAANNVNYGDPDTDDVDTAVADAEGKSEETETSS